MQLTKPIKKRFFGKIFAVVRYVMNYTGIGLSRHFEAFSPPIKTFALVNLLGFPVIYLLWDSLQPFAWEPISSWRIIAAVLNSLLLIYAYWPQKLIKHLPIFWYTTVCYTLPFLGTLTALQYHFSSLWQTYSLLTLILLCLILDWLAFIIILPLGIMLGCGAFYFYYGEIILYENSLFNASIIYVLTIMVMVLFSRNRAQWHKAKVQDIQTDSASVAHELRTPLAAVDAANHYIKDQLTSMSQMPGSENIEELLKTFKKVQMQIQSSHYLLDMLLPYEKLAINQKKFRYYSMHDCVTTTLSNYPFLGNQADYIRYIDDNAEFEFWGDKILMIHVLTNLIKNALTSIAKANKGSITIWHESNNKYNLLYFEDSGMGVNTKKINRIFQIFMTEGSSGMGVGLAFCKKTINKFRGTMTCKSEQGKYTLFIISLPKGKKINDE
ncbi:MAG: hypothetical protein COB66_08150 [Coxiella sp. (in: Bacteria)]|nr:MAG: hypothetical protein COB66_08150 [Coxiella sp. (in: g-proteobacteria)]